MLCDETAIVGVMKQADKATGELKETTIEFGKDTLNQGNGAPQGRILMAKCRKSRAPARRLMMSGEAPEMKMMSRGAPEMEMMSRGAPEMNMMSCATAVAAPKMMRMAEVESDGIAERLAALSNTANESKRKEKKVSD